jgi:hypothetical protein
MLPGDPDWGLAGVLDLPDAAGLARDALVLQHVQAGQAEVRWTTLTVGRIRLTVMADALKLGGVRVGAGAGLAQQCADVLGAMLLTPKVLDLMYAARSVTVPPMLQFDAAQMLTTHWFVKESSRIDQAIATAGGSDGLIQTVGKPWMLTNGLLAHPGHACNYGWHCPPGSVSGGKWQGTAAYPSVTLPSIYVLQQPGYFHNLDEADYAEMMLFMSKACLVDDESRDLSEVLQDATLASLISHEGPLKVTRQPGVAQLAPIAGGHDSPGVGRLALLAAGAAAAVKLALAYG